MAAQQDPNLGLNYGWDLGEDNWNTGMDANLLKLGALVGGAVEGIAAAPTVTTAGARYIVAASPSGAFATATVNQLAVRVGTTWMFYTPQTGWDFFNKSTGTIFRFTGSAWVEDTTTSTAQLARRHEDNLMGGVAGVANSPTVTTDGTRYIVGSAPTGAFAAATANQIAARYNGAWTFYTPFNGQKIYNKGVGTDYQFNGTVWAAVATDGPLATKHENVFYGSVQAVANSPTITTNGTRYIVGSSPTGAFAGQANNLAVMVSGAWVFYPPFNGLSVYNLATGTEFRYGGSTWATVLAGYSSAEALAGVSDTMGLTPGGLMAYLSQYGGPGSTYNATVANLNLLKSGANDVNRFFSFDNTTLNTPFSGAYGKGVQIAGGGNYSRQIVWINGSSDEYWRENNGGTWTGWTKSAFNQNDNTSTAWNAITLQNGWTVTSGNRCAYRKVMGKLQVWFSAQQGATTGDVPIGSMPAGYAPLIPCSFIAASIVPNAGLTPRVVIFTDGRIECRNCSSYITFNIELPLE